MFRSLQIPVRHPSLPAQFRRLASTTPTPRPPKIPKIPIPPAVPKRRKTAASADVKVRTQLSPSQPATSVRTTPTPTTGPTTLSNASTPNTIKGYKEQTQIDIAHAEQHGVLTPPPDGATWTKRTFHKVIQLAKFYYRGIKLINVHRKHVALIRSRVKEDKGGMSRWEVRFLEVYRRDVIKLIPFVITVIILEEIIPLIALYAPGFLPSTCVLPAQRARIIEKRTAKAREFAWDSEVRIAMGRLVRSGAAVGGVDVKSLGRVESIGVCGILSLSTRGPQFRLVKRLRRHLERVVKDDALLAKEEFGDRLVAGEVREALEERGILTTDKPLPAQQALLKQWLKEATKGDQEENVQDAVDRRLGIVIRNFSVHSGYESRQK